MNFRKTSVTPGRYRRLFPVLVAAAAVVAFSAPQLATISLDSSTTFQTIDGWEATAFAAQIDGPMYAVHPSWATDSPVLMDLAVNDLGLTRLRVEVRSGVENPTDYYQQFKDRLIDRPTGFTSHMYDVVNDNSDPLNTNLSRFHWTELDETIQLVVNPFRAKVLASGQTPYFTLCFVDFGSVAAFQQADNPQEYAEFMVATFQHIQSTFGWVPNGFDVVLEGDIAQRWQTPTKIANNLVAAVARLNAAGFHPDVTAPSSTSLNWAATNIDAILAVPGVAASLKTIAYHLYWNSADTDMATLASRAAARGMHTSMNEMIGADQIALSKDLRIANVSSWQQYNIASYFGPDQGAKYYLNTTGSYVPGDRTRYLRQYFRYIRPGAVRIAANSSNPALTPVAFINTGGRYAVVVNADSAQAFTVSDLPAGNYGIRYTTAGETDVDPGSQTIGAGGTVSTSIPGAGTITIYRLNAQAAPGAFSKTAPGSGAAGQPSSLTLSWGASSGATSYDYCLDTINNGTCDTAWVGAGAGTSATVNSLAASTTYYWQVRANNASGTPTYADGASSTFWNFSTQGAAAPGAFSKSSPGNGATGLSSSLSLSWTPSSGATGYDYCVDTTNNGACDTGWIAIDGAPSVGVSGLAAGATYYWQVRAKNATGILVYANGAASAFFSFDTQTAAPGAFSKSTPANGASGLATSLSLAWGASSGATGYEYCVDTSNNSACDTGWVAAGGALLASLTSLTANTTYYWQVRATNASGTPIYADGAPSAFWSFSTQVAAPGAFSKTAPANGLLGVPTSLTLTWSASNGATSYDYCIDTLNNGVCDGAWTPTALALAINLPALSLNTTYYWQVRATNASGTPTYADGGAATFWSFGTLAGGAGVFVKSTPWSGTNDTATTLLLNWGPSLLSTGYEYCLDTTNDDACTTWISVGKGFSAFVTDLLSGTTYYWQVRATSLIGPPTYANGAPNAFWSFTTQATPPGPFGKTGPALGSTGQAGSLTLAWAPSAGATGYEYCFDTTDNATCDAAWVSAGANTSAPIFGLVNGTAYFWQVRATNTTGTPTYADGAAAAFWNFSTIGAQRADLTSPAPGSTLSASTLTFQWTGGIGVTRYWLSVGSSVGAADIFDRDMGTSLSVVVDTLPIDGGTIFVRLQSQIGGVWVFNDYTLIAPRIWTIQKADLLTPAPGTTLSTSTVAFEWTGGVGATSYLLSIGSEAGASDVFQQDEGLNLSAVATGLPTDGRTLYVRLSSQLNGGWEFNDYTLTSAFEPVAKPKKAELTSPAPGSSLTASNVAFTWTGGTGVTGFSLAIGSAPGSSDFFNRDLGMSLDTTVEGLPTDGRALYVRLSSQIAGVWEFTDYALTAPDQARSASLAELISPAAGSTLTETTVNFEWTGGTGASAYFLYVGTSVGGWDLVNRDIGSCLSTVVSGLPIGGQPIYVRLFSLVDESWQYNDYVLSTPAVVKPQRAELTSPAAGSTLTASTVTFEWTGGMGATGYRLFVGTAPGLFDLVNRDVQANLSFVASGLPTDGRTLYVRLSSLLDGAWEYTDYTLHAATILQAHGAELTSPAAGSTLTSTTVKFEWTGGTGTQFRLTVGSAFGASDLADLNAETALSAFVPGLPSDGSTLYVRLYALVDGTWVWRDYTLTAATR